MEVQSIFHIILKDPWLLSKKKAVDQDNPPVI